jgi:PAP2 superfamily
LYGAVLGVLNPLPAQAQSTPDSGVSRFFETVADDYSRHYASDQLTRLGIVLAGAGVLANTALDEKFQTFYQEEIRSDSGNNIAEDFRHVGDAAQLKYAMPFYLGAMLVSGYTGDEDADNVIAAWGSRSLRTVLIGAPQQLILTHLTGAHRPDEGDSDWRPLHDGNGVSGHAFFGAVPFLTAAKLADSVWLKTPLYFTSVLPGLSRLHEDRHYLSQIFIGWSIAYIAADSVVDSSRHNNKVSIMPSWSQGELRLSFFKSF